MFYEHKFKMKVLFLFYLQFLETNKNFLIRDIKMFKLV